MLNDNNRKAELSYAYLHAVSAAAGFGCTYSDRHLDGTGVDAQVNIKERLDSGSVLTEFSLHFQLKATSQELAMVDLAISFSLEVPQYDNLRRADVCIPKFMVLMCLPQAPEQWLEVSHDQLVTRKCARWVSLRGAPATTNSTSIAVYVPQINILDPVSLRDMAKQFSLGKHVLYAH
jgi:hypothetical protein